MGELPFVLLKFKDGNQYSALIVCPEKIEPNYKRVTENDQYVIYGDFYNEYVTINEAPLYAVAKE